VMSPDEHESRKETIYITSRRSLIADIRKGLKIVKKSYTVEELLKETG